MGVKSARVRREDAVSSNSWYSMITGGDGATRKQDTARVRCPAEGISEKEVRECSNALNTTTSTYISKTRAVSRSSAPRGHPASVSRKGAYEVVRRPWQNRTYSARLSRRNACRAQITCTASPRHDLQLRGATISVRGPHPCTLPYYADYQSLSLWSYRGREGSRMASQASC